MDIELDVRTALVTGASREIGQGDRPGAWPIQQYGRRWSATQHLALAVVRTTEGR